MDTDIFGDFTLQDSLPDFFPLCFISLMENNNNTMNLLTIYSFSMWKGLEEVNRSETAQT